MSHQRPRGFGLACHLVLLPGGAIEQDLYFYETSKDVRILGNVFTPSTENVVIRVVEAVRLLDPDASIHIRACNCRCCLDTIKGEGKG